jgi:ABC-type antimicrobial peptide transport system permease subunit
MASIRQSIHEFSSELVIHHPEDMTRTVADSIENKRFAMALLAVFAMLALLLASIGIYGVLSYMVGQRTREIGVRMALGAQRLDVLRMVLRDGSRMTVIGIGIGVAAAIALTRLMADMLFGVKPLDPATFVCVPLVLALVALFACYMPARKAMKVDPMEALRQQ